MAAKHTDIAEEGELFCTHIGGSATLEGVMMRGKLNWAVAVRCEDGSIYVEEHDLPDASSRPAWFRWPIVRGCVSFAESMVLAYRALDIASEHVSSTKRTRSRKTLRPTPPNMSRAMLRRRAA